MAPRTVRVLLLGDTHLGFDLPSRPRIERRRRGPDFFAAYERALSPTRRGQVDVVVHGGDLLYRSKVPSWLVARAMEPLFEVADRGVPVFVVPGNHERSRIPYPLLTRHPGVHVFEAPSTFRVDVRGTTVALSGFPFARVIAGESFAALLAATGWASTPADLRLLCLHQAVEGARVGVQDFTFRRGPDVLAGRDVPAGFAAVLSGHIHRAQVLTQDLRGRPLPAPVVYPGSTERTSFAERAEPKGYVLLELVPGRGSRQPWVLGSRRFVPLPTRPMVVVDLDVDGLSRKELASRLRARLATLDPDAVVRLRCDGVPRADAAPLLSAPTLRTLAPRTMNVELPRPFPRA